MKMARFILLTLLLTALGSHGQGISGPGWFQTPILTVAEIEFSEEPGEPVEELARLDLPEIAEASTPEMEALARGLENDPKRIFDYVHDRVRYVHYFGSKKGAQLTLLERSGNDFDQSALLVALLRSAGHTASYQFGMTYLPYEKTNQVDFRHWVGTTKPNSNRDDTAEFVASLNPNSEIELPQRT
jgi:transglutaminase-like putative cysteine protease